MSATATDSRTENRFCASDRCKLGRGSGSTQPHEVTRAEDGGTEYRCVGCGSVKVKGGPSLPSVGGRPLPWRE